MAIFGIYDPPSTLSPSSQRANRRGRRPGEVAEDVVMLAAPAATAAGMTPQEAQEVPKMELFFLAGEERGWLD